MKMSPWVALSLVGTILILFKPKTSPTPTVLPTGGDALARAPVNTLTDDELAQVITNPINFPPAYVTAAVAEGVARVAVRPNPQVSTPAPKPTPTPKPTPAPKPTPWSEQVPDSFGQTVIATGNPDEIWNYFKDSNNIEGVREAAQKLAALGDTRAAELNYLLSQIIMK